MIEDQELGNAIEILRTNSRFHNSGDEPANSSIDRGGPISEANLNASTYFEAARQHFDFGSKTAHQTAGRRQIVLDPAHADEEPMDNRAQETATAGKQGQNLLAMGPLCVTMSLPRNMSSYTLSTALSSPLKPDKHCELNTLTRMNSVINRTSPVRRRQPSLRFKPPFLAISH